MIVLSSFIMGGLLCLLAQLLIDFTTLTPARILVLYVCSGVFLHAVGLFDFLRESFGCGVTLPLLGFGANIAKGVEEGILKEGWRGIFSGPLFSCGGGICFTLVFAFLVSIFFKSKSKKM